MMSLLYRTLLALLEGASKWILLVLGSSRERKKVVPEIAATTAEYQDLTLLGFHLGISRSRLNSRMVSVRCWFELVVEMDWWLK